MKSKTYDSQVWLYFTAFILSIFAIGMTMVTSGCSKTTITVEDVDPVSKAVTKRTITEADGTMANIILSTQNKTIITWNTGWFFWLEFSPGTPDNPTPHMKMKGGNIDSGIALIHKDHYNVKDIATIIGATRSNVSMSPSGVSSSAGVGSPVPTIPISNNLIPATIPTATVIPSLPLQPGTK